MARILVFKIMPSQEILKIRDGTPLEKKRVARILVFKIRPSQEILKIRDVARILVFKIRPSQEINIILDGTPLEAEEILTYRKALETDRKEWHGFYFSKFGHLKKFSKFVMVPLGGGGNFDIQKKALEMDRKEWHGFWFSQLGHLKKFSNSWEKLIRARLEKKRVARILVFKITPSQEINIILDGTPLEAEEILTYRKALETDRKEPSQEILKIRDDVPSNVLQKKRVARILVFKIRPSQGILKIRDGTPLEAQEILTYIKSHRNGSVCYFSSKLDVPSNVLQKKRVARILVFKIRPSQEINIILDGTPLEAEEILTYRKALETDRRKEWHGFWFSQLGHLKKFSNSWEKLIRARLEKKRVARILVFKITPSQEINIILDGTPLEAEEILTYRKALETDRPSQEILKIRDVARILVFKIRPSQEILKIRDGTPLEKRVARILVFKIMPSQEILKIRDEPSQEINIILDGTPLEIRKEWHGFWFSQLGHLKKFSNSWEKLIRARLEKKRVARILVFKITPSQEINIILDGTPLEAEEILTYRKALETDRKKRVARILVFKIRPSQEILKIRDVKKRVARILKKRVARILVFKIRPSQGILKIRDGTPLEAEEILTYIKSHRNGSVCYFSSKLDVPSNVLQKKRVARILVFKIRPSQEINIILDGTPLEAEEILTYRKALETDRFGTFLKFSKFVMKFSKFVMMPSQEILKIRDGTPLEKKKVARILVFKIWPSQEILKIRNGTPLEAEEILTYIKSHRNGSVCYFSSKLDVPSNVLQKKRVARILVFKIRPSQEINIILDGTPLEAEEILTYSKALEIDRFGTFLAS
ncbi:hypothetical protein OROHE_008810 [Orobanche hederae]